jgi:predicted acetyltransferase
MSFTDTPIDATSAERLRENHLRLDLVDTSDTDAFTAWYQADARGFYGPRTAQKQLDEQLSRTAYRRTTGVWDETAADPLTPVATVSSWPTPMMLPGGRDIESWAISSVTVAPTHRRRGIARALLEAELRTAKSLGIPVAALTVSEATIYSRYGFGPAAQAVDLEINTRRARWVGPQASGRLHFVTLEQLRDSGRAVFERARLANPGDIELDDQLWERLVGVIGDSDEEAKHLRAVRYDDANGVMHGFAIYRVTGGEQDFTQHTAEVRYLCAATAEASAGLWRYLLELDLVSTVSTSLRSIDDPILWQVSDVRAVRTKHRSDHLWVRILDVAAALEGRGYSASGRFVLDIDDPLGFASERALVSIDEGGHATVSDAARADAGDLPGLALPIDMLGALYLGGVSARTLVRAGRIRELSPGSADAVDASFRSPTAPWLSTWF